MTTNIMVMHAINTFLKLHRHIMEQGLRSTASIGALDTCSADAPLKGLWHPTCNRANNTRREAFAPHASQSSCPSPCYASLPITVSRKTEGYPSNQTRHTFFESIRTSPHLTQPGVAGSRLADMPSCLPCTPNLLATCRCAL